MAQKTLSILGIRGVPAAHGGFETFAEYLCQYLGEHHWKVTVYCQKEGSGSSYEDKWNDVRRVNIPVTGTGPFSTIKFDFLSTLHALRENPSNVLTLGYNTAAFCIALKWRGIHNTINMDGIEWSRAKWGPLERTWLWINEWIGARVGNKLVADHPVIEEYLRKRTTNKSITTIAYGAPKISNPDPAPLAPLSLVPNEYLTIIARPEPENNILEMVRAFSSKRRGVKLVVLGNYDTNKRYHCQVLSAASDEVIFPGAIYDWSILAPLRYYSQIYLHGHQVGGTNPSLVEALGASNPVLAHNNRFNRWVAGNGAEYFSNEIEFESRLSELINNQQALSEMRKSSAARFEEEFTWDTILSKYEHLLSI